MPRPSVAMRAAVLAALVSLPGCGSSQDCWPGKEGGCSGLSRLALSAGVGAAALTGGRGGGAEEAPAWRRPLPGPARRGAFTVAGTEQAQGWGIRRAMLVVRTQSDGRDCAPGPIHYGSGDTLLGCILAADAVVAGVRVPAGHGFLCRPDERGCVVYAAAPGPALRIGLLELRRGWGVTVADGRVEDRLGIDPARALDLPTPQRAALEAEGLRVGAWRLLRPQVVPAGFSGIVAQDARNPDTQRDGQQDGQRITVAFDGTVLPAR